MENEYWFKGNEALPSGSIVGMVLPLVDKHVSDRQNCMIPHKHISYPSALDMSSS